MNDGDHEPFWNGQMFAALGEVKFGPRPVRTAGSKDMPANTRVFNTSAEMILTAIDQDPSWVRHQARSFTRFVSFKPPNEPVTGAP